MARVDKKEVIKKEKVVAEPSGITGIKEESPKGELFFKIVLIVMAAALVGVVLYFVIDALIGDGNTNPSKRYNENNYITSYQVQQIKSGENFENIAHAGLRDALDNYAYVYIFFYADNTDGLTASTLDRQNQALEVMDQIMDLDVKEITLNAGTSTELTYLVINDDVAFFFLDTSLASNADWVNSVDTTEGQAAAANVPLLLEIHNGEDLEWFGPWTKVDSNQAALTKLQSVLADLQ